MREEHTCKSAFYSYAKQRLNHEITGVFVGVKYVGVLLDNEYLGVSSVDHFQDSSRCCKALPDAGTYNELTLDALTDKIDSENAIEKSIGYAAMNAISQADITSLTEFKNGSCFTKDILDIILFPPSDDILMIGDIIPIRVALERAGSHVHVIDRGKNRSLLSDRVEFDKLVISGSAISNETIDQLLIKYDSRGEIILLGPSAQVFPPVFFNMSCVDVIGSMYFTEPQKAIRVIQQAGGTQQFQKHARKYVFLKSTPAV